MPPPVFITTQPDTVKTHVHEVTTRKPDYFDWLTLVLPVIVTLITFRLAYLLNERVENRKERKRLEDVKEYFLTLTEVLVEVTKNQSNYITDSIARYEAMENMDMRIPLEPNLSTEKIRAIPDLDLYKIFIANKGKVKKTTEVLNGLTITLNYIDANSDILKNLDAAFSKKATDYMTATNKLLAELVDENNQLLMEGKFKDINTRDEESYNLYMIFATSHNEAMGKFKAENIGGSNLAKRFEYYIKPIVDRTKDIKSNANTYNRLKNIQRLRNDWENLLNSRDIFLNSLRSYAFGFQANSDRILQVQNALLEPNKPAEA